MFGLGKHDLEDALLEAALVGDQVALKEILGRRVEAAAARARRQFSRHHEEVEEGDTALHLAARAGHEPAARLLLSVKVPVNAPNGSGATPLHVAAAEGREQIVRLLLNWKARVDAKDDRGRTPLHLACQEGREGTAQVLLDEGAERGARDADGNTPLHHAAGAGSLFLVKVLASRGANVNDVNHHERTPLHLAIVAADHSAAGRLLPNGRAQRESTARLVKLLLTLGAEPNAVDHVNETALDVMSYLEGDVEADPVAQTLLEAGGTWVRYRSRHPGRDWNPVSAAVRPDRSPRTTKPGQPRETPAPGESFEDPEKGPIVLGKNPVTIGRAPDCDVRYESRAVSRHHARIQHLGRGYLITDLGSHNGTIVDGERITAPHLLEPGEILRIGNDEFVFDGSRLVPRVEQLFDRRGHHAVRGSVCGKT